MAKNTCWGIVALLAFLALAGCNRDSGNAADVHYDGFLEGAQSGQIWGWAWDRNHPNTHVNVDILDGNTVLTTVAADKSRQDLAKANIGNGDHSFLIPPPVALKDGRSHVLHAKVSGSNFELHKSPITFPSNTANH